MAAIELNLSCPNVEEAPESASEIVAAARRQTRKTLYAKLSPAATDLPDTARAVQAAGADGLTLVNTMRGLALDDRTLQPRLGRETGGYSGPGLKPIALAAVYQCYRATGTADRGHGRHLHGTRRPRVSRRRRGLDRARNDPLQRPGRAGPSASRAG